MTWTARSVCSKRDWSDDEIRLAESLPADLFGLLLDDPTRPRFELMDADRWYVAHGFLMEGFALGDPAWESLAFRLWLTRVLAYTTNQARQGVRRRHGVSRIDDPALRGDRRRILLIPGAGRDLAHTHRERRPMRPAPRSPPST